MNSNETIANSFSVPIEKLMLWRGTWTKYEHKAVNIHLRVVYDQLLITADMKILESFNMHHKIKGVFKDNILILIVNNNNNELRKLKFLIKSNVSKCLETLGNHFPVLPHNGFNCIKPYNGKFRSVNETFKHALACTGQSGAANLPKEFENFVKLCLLDPCFPQMISETENMLKEILK